MIIIFPASILDFWGRSLFAILVTVEISVFSQPTSALFQSLVTWRFESPRDLADLYRSHSQLSMRCICFVILRSSLSPKAAISSSFSCKTFLRGSRLSCQVELLSCSIKSGKVEQRLLRLASERACKKINAEVVRNFLRKHCKLFFLQDSVAAA